MATAQANSDSKVELRLSPWKGLPSPGPRHEGPMPRFDLGSDSPLPDIDSLPVIRPFDEDEEAEAGTAGGEIWLNGDALMCMCPECKAPISVRVWLMLAECWRCDTSVELSEQQQRDARRLIQQREASPTPPQDKSATDRRSEIPPRATASPSTRPVPRPTSPVPPPAPANSPEPPPLPSGRGGAAAPPKTPPAGAKPAGNKRLKKAQDEGGILAAIGDLFRSMPAWMVSLVVHIVLLTLLALFSRDRYTGEEPIILVSTAVSTERKEGAEVRITKPEDEIKFDLPIPDKDVPKTETQKQAMILADQDARKLRLDPDVDAQKLQLPDLVNVKRQIGAADPQARMVAARDPRVRVEMVKREGGTTRTEAAVSRGLRWLASVQNKDGSWSLEKHGGTIKSDSAATSLALLPFLGAGQTHQQGIYKDHVARGLRRLLEHQNKQTGDLRIDSQGHTGMYAHGQGAIVLSEAFAMTGDEDLRVPAQKALDFIRDAQHSRGGWRYTPGQEGDTSVLGWQLMALQSGRAANLTVPDSTLQLAGQFLDRVQFDNGAQYKYQAGAHTNAAMTAEGLLCRMYLGWNFRDDPSLQRGVDFLLERHMPTREAADIYYWYYGTQVLHHAGGESWDKWNNRMREILVDAQEKSGADAGSWPPLGQHSAAGGRVYATSLCTATLEIYYRHAPIFRQIKLE